MSNGLFDQMAADAEAFSNVTTGAGSKLASLIKEAQRQSELMEQFEQAAKDAKKEYQRITRELIPSEMQAMGVDRIDVDGNSVTVSPFVYASIPEGRKQEAFSYLRSIGEDDIIKNEIKVTFGRGQDNQAGAFYDDCLKNGLDPDQRQSVHHSTLNAWIKDKLASGHELDLDMFGAYVGNEAKIKRK